MRRRLTAAVIASFALCAAAIPPAADAHRSGCHSKHECPSDHATYKWKGKWCVKPSSDQREAKHKKKIRYDGKTYYCTR